MLTNTDFKALGFSTQTIVQLEWSQTQTGRQSDFQQTQALRQS